MIALIQLLLPLALKLIGLALDQHKDANEARESFLKFLDALQKAQIASVSAKESIRKQKEKLAQKSP